MFLKFSVERSHLVSNGLDEATWASREVLINTINIVSATLRDEAEEAQSLIIETTDGSIQTFPGTADTLRVWEWMESKAVAGIHPEAKSDVSA